ncbi:MAG: hypothetical protein Q9165_004015 [Trypethelium subeluteriae]
MSSRYPNSHESRYPPRDRSRSPPRYSDRRGSAVYQSAVSTADVPRGPKALVEPSRPPGPGTLSTVPAGPRGRGFGGRPDYRDPRDTPASSERDRSWRDRDYDRRDRSGRSPTRDFRENRDYPRDLDTTRARRGSRDGPPSASSTYSDPPSFSSAPFGRGGFARGRGRGEYDYRGRGRGLYPDERDVFRPRSRSRGPARREKEFVRDDRDFERVEDRRYERWEDDRRPERDDRDRDRERDRDFDRQRRDLPPTRLDLRQGSSSAGPSTPHPLSASSSHPPPLDRAAGTSTPRDAATSRRGSAGIFPSTHKELRRESERSDSFTSRAESSREKYAQRPESPPPQAPQVPAFGSLPQFKTSSYNGPPSNVWRAPVENKASEIIQSGPAPPQAPKDAPVAPKAQLTAAPPTGPRSSRPLSERSSVGDLSESASYNLQDAKPKEGTSISQPTTPQPTPSAKMPVANQPVAVRPSPHQAEPTAIAPTGPRGTPGGPGPVSGPRVAAAAAAPYSFTKSPGQAPVRPSTPPTFAPLGPRSAPQPNTSPKALGVNVPTGPRGNRVTMPSRPGPGLTPERRAPAAPRAGFGAGRGSNQWISPRVQQYGSNVVPAKRDSAGEEVVRETNNSRGESKIEPVSALQEAITKIHSDDPVDHQSGVVALKTEQEEPQLKSVTESAPIQEDGTINTRGGTDSTANKQSRNAASQAGTGEVASDDDDGLDLDEEDFMRTEDFANERQRLEASKLDLSARHVRSTTPLRRIALLARIASVDLAAVKFFVPEPPKSRLGLGEHRSSVQARARKAAQASMLTPKAEDSEDTVMSDDITLHEASPNRMPSPDPRSLPHLLAAPPTPLSDQAPFQESLALHEESKDTIADYFMNHIRELDTEYEKMRSTYATQYKIWKTHVQSLDHDKELAEKVRQKSAEPVLAPEPALPPTTPITESRRAHKFNTDYDVERALKESMDTHREEQEKAKREASQAKADFTKEACIPPMLDKIELSQPKFKDINNLRDPADLTAIYGFIPPKDNFTQEEHEILVQSYHMFPKKWGRIAEELKPRRSYKECINHYYATKWNGEYKDNRSRTGRRGGRVPRGRAAKGQPRMKSGVVVTSEMDAKPDLYEGNEYQAPTVSTESGRPRRAAAPVNFGADKDNDGKQGTPTTTPGRKATAINRFDGSSDPAPQKTVRRQKGAGKEKAPRKTKGQTVALAPAGSPLKTEKLLESRASDQTVDDIPLTTRLEDASLLANLQTGQSQPTLEKPTSLFEMQPKPSMSTPAPPDRPSTGGGEKSKSQTATQQRTGPSSYWSVPEVNDFPKNVAHFGTDWTAIANHMGTKTQTMVKNYYVRLIEGNRPDLQHVATLADQRRERGEDLGPPPTATPLTKRRYENPQPPAPRPLAPNPEVVEVEDHSPPLRPQPQQSQQSPRQLPLDSRAPPPFTGATQGQTAATSRPSSSSTALQNQPAPKRPSQQQGPPVMGYFPEARTEGRSSAVGTSAPPQAQGHVELHVKSHQPAIAVNRDGQDDQFRRRLIAQQDHAMEVQAIEAKQAMEAQAHVRLQQQTRERAPSASSAPQHVTPRPPVAEVPQIRSASIDQRPAAEPRRSPSSQPNPLPPRQPQSNIRHLIDLTPQASHAPSPLTTPVSQAPPTSVLKDEARSHSVPIPPSGPHPIAAPPPAPRPPQEPRKTSNIASILNPLNDEPEEPRPRKKPVEQVSATPTPTQVAPSHGFPPPAQGPSFSRHDSHSEPSISQASMQRDQFGRPVPHPAQAPPRHHSDFVSREQVRDNAPRQEWGPRPGYAAYPRASSPQSVNERMAESRQVFPHRASVLGPLNDQSRHNPSPPPHQGFSHSRTPSYQQTQMAQPQSQQSPNPLNQSSQILQPNPYAQQGVPAPVTRAPTQTMQPPSQQQPPLQFHSISHLSQNPHQRHMSLQHHRDHEVLSRQHEESREREREQVQTQAHNAHSHAQNRYTPIQHAEPRYPPPPPRQTTTTPLQHHNPHQPPPPPEFLQQHPPQQHDPRYPPPGSREEERMRMEHQHQHRWREDEEARRRQNFGRHTDTRTPPGPGSGYAAGGGIFGPPPRGR